MKREKARLTVDELYDLFSVKKPEDFFDGVDFFQHWPGAAEEELQRAEQEEQDKAWTAYTEAVETVATNLFREHKLDLIPIKKRFKGHEFTSHYRVEPVHDATWRDAANELRTTINGYGLFGFNTLKDFLDSGPYTPRQAVLQHLGWVPTWVEVYEGGKAKSRIEDAYRRALR